MGILWRGGPTAEDQRLRRKSVNLVGNSDPPPHSASTAALHVGYQQNRRRARAAKPIIWVGNMYVCECLWWVGCMEFLRDRKSPSPCFKSGNFVHARWFILCAKRWREEKRAENHSFFGPSEASKVSTETSAELQPYLRRISPGRLRKQGHPKERIFHWRRAHISIRSRQVFVHLYGTLFRNWKDLLQHWWGDHLQAEACG